ncbi:PREDICTED: protocadherin gamma-B1-like [Nanorana parkeri]|uniref:protocadherin gamma-B1-like n=1 Tax=Nanorana parkeri TaxID=125878 RepID=UPI00085474A8|nr:PREDICTED: protocadherin gamma-B1-like [Nanorana parkeri]
MAKTYNPHTQNCKRIKWQVTFFFLFLWLCHSVLGQIHYSIVEEMRKDSTIANIVKDLALDINQLSSIQLQIVSDVSQKYIYFDLNNGNLYVKDRIDRETLCGTAATCILTFDVLAENPLKVFKVNVEIQDINDNSPVFFQDTITLQIPESASIGTHFALKNAEDLDIGMNSVQTYRLTDNQYFTLTEKISSDGSKSPKLFINKALDREIQNSHELILTALDGGDPIRTGTALITITITDANDNFPVFNQEMYKVLIKENVPINSTVIIVEATDKDEGSNAQITYSFTKTSGNVHHTGVFSIHPIHGHIKVTKLLDFEVTKKYELSIQAMDGGGLAAHSKVLVEVEDENDNAPNIFITSLSSPVSEDSASGTAIALVRVHDKDSGENGDVNCQLLELVPFQLVLLSDNYYRIVTTSDMDREKVAFYNITILASDKGYPSLSSQKIIKVEISDVNDNPPVFMKSSYITYIPENNLPGASIYSIQASDPDTGDNAKITYSILSKNKEDILLSSYLSINIETGALYAQRSFDYEKQKEFILQVTAMDHGSPSLNSSIKLIIHIVDKNDNAPKILYPSPESAGSAVFEMVLLASVPGSLITKVVAVDADTGHNSWLSYHFIQVPGPAYFIIDEHTGEIRTSRAFQDKDILNHKVVVMVKDNGYPSLSATVTLSLAIADNVQQAVPKLGNQITEEDPQTNLQLYLIIALALISLLFILTVMIAIISKCKESQSPQLFGPLSSNLYPQLESRILSQYTNGTLTLPYNFCVALESTEHDFTFIKPNENVSVDNLLDTDDSGLGAENGNVLLTLNNHTEVSF